MAIRQKGNKWQVDVTWQGLRAPRVSCNTKEEAARIEARFKSQLMAGEKPSLPGEAPALSVGNSVASLGRLVQYVVTHRWKGTKAEVSSTRNASAWVEELGADFPVAKLDLATVDDVCARWAAADNKPSTINRKLAALSVMLKVAYERGEIDRVPKLPKKREYEGRLRWFSEEELASMDAFFAGDQDFLDLIHLALDTGFRYGELFNLTSRDFNPSTGKLSAWVTKGDKPRSVPLTPRSREIILRRGADRRDWDELFPERLNSRNISRMMSLWKTHVGLPTDDEAVFHSFRHTCCSRLVQAGVSMPIVQKWMGHASIQTTMRYAHLAPDALDDALAALS